MMDANVLEDAFACTDADSCTSLLIGLRFWTNRHSMDLALDLLVVYFFCL